MQKTRVVYVDDNRVLLEIFREFFLDEYDVRVFQSPLEALAEIRGCAADVVISDLSIPEMSGVEFLSLVREVCPDSVRVVLTGFSTAGEMMEELTTGLVHHFITKPWREEQLREVLERASLIGRSFS